MSFHPTTVLIDYTNWRGERSVRRVRPLSIRFENTEYHPATQWLMEAVDLDKGAVRTFAMRDIHSWKSLDGGHQQQENAADGK